MIRKRLSDDENEGVEESVQPTKRLRTEEPAKKEESESSESESEKSESESSESSESAEPKSENEPDCQSKIRKTDQKTVFTRENQTSKIMFRAAQMILDLDSSEGNKIRLKEHLYEVLDILKKNCDVNVF